MAIQVSWAQFQAPNHAPGVPVNPTDPCFGRRILPARPEACGCDCAGGCVAGGVTRTAQEGCGCGCPPPGCCPAGPGVPCYACNPVRFATGEVQLIATDLKAEGFGVPWGHTRSYANRLTQSTNVGNGTNWQVREWPYLVFQDAGTVVVMGQANYVLWFDPAGSAYVPRFSVRQSLVFDSANNVFDLVDLDGSVLQFNATSGALVGHTDPAGNVLAVVSYTANNFNFTEVRRTASTGGTTTIESFLYQYANPSATRPLLSTVTLRRSTNGGSTWTNVAQAVYTYYGSGDPNGGLNDLQTVVTQTWVSNAWVASGTTLYRYWTTVAGSSSSSAASGSPPAPSSSSSGASIPADLLKFVVNPAAYNRLAASVPNPLTAPDSVVARYADNYFEYDSGGRVTREVVKGGSLATSFASEQSGNPNGYNSWTFKTTETLPDGSQNVVYANYAGQTMLKVFQSGSGQWLDFYQYDNRTGDLILHANPSAVSGYGEQYADLLNNVGGVYRYLNNNAGLIRTYQYHPPTGYLAAELIQQGQLGPPILLRQYQYVACSSVPEGAVSSSSSSSSSSSAARQISSSSSARRSSSSSAPRSSSSSAPSSSSASSSPSPAFPDIYFLAAEISYPSDGLVSSSSSASVISSSVAGLPQIVTSYSYLRYPGTCQIQLRTTTLPVIPSGQNGSGVANTRQDYFDIYGTLTWHMDECGFLTYTAHDAVTAALIQRIDDVNTAILAAPLGWTTPAGGGLHLVTDYTIDSEGRAKQVLGPAHTIDLGGVATTIRRATWTIYQDATFQTWIGQGYATGSAPNYTYTLVNPVSITIGDADGKLTDIVQATRASTTGALQPTDSFAQSSYVRWSTEQYADGYHLSSTRVYKLIPSSGTGSSGTHYDETDFGYDVMFRQNRQVTPGGTIGRQVFDARNNAVSSWTGTNDTGATDGDPTGGGAPGNNMVQVGGRQYDNGQPGGDNNQTQVSQYVDGSTVRVTNFLFDWRNRPTDTRGEVDFYQKVTYDNLNRIVTTERYDTSPAGNLVARTVSLSDDMNRVYQTVRYGVDPATGTVGNSLVDNAWYEPTGKLLKSQPAGSQLFTKYVYDGLGRVLVQYTGYDLTETSYADAGSVTDDTILEQVERSYDAAGNVTQTTTRLRYHNATGVGPLGSPSSAQPQARVTYLAQYADALGRTQASADYGTNGGSALVRSATIPARADTVLVTSTRFDSAGNVQTVTDPAGTVICFTFDSAGREIQKILNCLTASSSSSSSSSAGGCPPSSATNITILTAYNADGNVSQVTVVNSATGNQVTQFIYGTTLTDSGIASSLLKRYEVYPDSVGGSDQVAFTYNRQGEVVTLTDQRGTVHAYDFDLLGRRTEDRITTIGAGVDNAVLRIETAYEVRGMASLVTSYDNATVGSGNVLNQVQLAYNNFAQLITDYQSHAGAVNPASTPSCQYAFAAGVGNTIRPTQVVYPNGRTLGYNYGTPGANEDATSRIASFMDNDGVTHLADYSYVGVDKCVLVNSAQASLEYTLIGTAGGNDPDTGDIYRGWDRFMRIKDLLWVNTATNTNLEEVQHGYDRAGNRVYRADPVDPLDKHDEFYGMDGLYRLHDLTRGSLNAGKTGILNPTFAECWALDETGNWGAYREASSGGPWDLVQSRLSNPANEITLVTNFVGPPWVTPVYDLAGNMTTLPQPAAPSSSLTATYDAWNRLVKVASGPSTVATYQYDGLKRRIVKSRYTGGVLSETRHLYYSTGWQVLEERVGASTNPNRQFVWGVHYPDDLILRDRDTTGSGTLNERFYAMQDPNWNVTGLVDTTGTVQERYSDAAYGMPTFLTPIFGPRANSSFDWETLFADYRWDNECGLYQVRNRVYAPHLGAWLQRDPLGLTAGLNLYEYVAAKPLNSVDPSGLLGPYAITFIGCLVGAGIWGAAELVLQLQAGGPIAWNRVICAAVAGCFGVLACATLFATLRPPIALPIPPWVNLIIMARLIPAAFIVPAVVFCIAVIEGLCDICARICRAPLLFC